MLTVAIFGVILLSVIRQPRGLGIGWHAMAATLIAFATGASGPPSHAIGITSLMPFFTRLRTQDYSSRWSRKNRLNE